jgi:uncharacterized protein (TIGR00730 family)
MKSATPDRARPAPASGRPIQSVVVFCASRNGNNPLYRQHAERLGALLAQAGYRLVYGGGMTGLMGAVAGKVLEHGGKVTAVTTPDFNKAASRLTSPHLTQYVAKTLHERKSRMIRMADAVIILPGGIGTFDEQWDVTALQDMRIAGQRRARIPPVIVLNTDGYYDSMKAQMLRAIKDGFIHPGRESIIRSAATPEDVMQKLAEWNKKGLLKAYQLAPGPR